MFSRIRTRIAIPAFVSAIAVFALALPAAASATPAGQITEFSDGLQTGSVAWGPSTSTGPDGNVWFGDPSGAFFAGGEDAIGKVAPDGSITEYTPSNSSFPDAAVLKKLAAGSDGRIWFIDAFTNHILNMSTDGSAASDFSSGLNPGASLNHLTPGPDGNMWFADNGTTPAIGRITPAGVITMFPTGIANTIGGVVAGPDDNIWFEQNSELVRLTLPGGTPTFTEFPIAGLEIPSATEDLVVGSDGNFWVTDQGTIDTNGALLRVTPSGEATRFIVGASTDSPTLGADGNIWYTRSGGTIGRITPAGVSTVYSDGLAVGATPDGIALGVDGNIWFGDNGTHQIGQVGVGAPPASLRKPSVGGTASIGSQQVCGGDRWASWAGSQPFDGGLLDSSTTPPAVQWLVDGAPVANAPSYTPVAGDLGKALSCKVSVSYRAPLGVTTSATSDQVTVVAQIVGPKGDTGDTGPQGPAGNDGATGQTGPQGPAGNDGAQGPQGNPGAQGPAGKDGAQGAAGKDGAQGPAGPTGKVVCKAKLKGKKVKVTCSIKTTQRAHLRWSLRRNGHTVRHGTSHGRHLRLGHLNKGHYRLHVQGAKGSTVVVVG